MTTKTNLFSLVDAKAGSSDESILWQGDTFKDATDKWEELVKLGYGTLEIYCLGGAKLATHENLSYMLSEPKATMQCPICGDGALHQHHQDLVAAYREAEIYKQATKKAQIELIINTVTALEGSKNE